MLIDVRFVADDPDNRAERAAAQVGLKSRALHVINDLLKVLVRCMRLENNNHCWYSTL